MKNQAPSRFTESLQVQCTDQLLAPEEMGGGGSL